MVAGTHTHTHTDKMSHTVFAQKYRIIKITQAQNVKAFQKQFTRKKLF